ncbi:MAG: hypothetical protein Q4P23_01000 [Micrococcaceae bacterium]|nr:hypothetical protein [Micrococcaceae bacterium]
MSNLPAQLIAQLRCPITGSILEQRGQQLISVGTSPAGESYAYPIVEGIPVMLANEAETLDAGIQD